MSANRPKPEASTSLQIDYGDPKRARSILEAITPDNLEAPQGIDVTAHLDGATLKISVRTRGVASLAATVDDLLSCIQAAETAIDEI